MKIKLPNMKRKEEKAIKESNRVSSKKKNNKDEKNVLSEKSKFAIVEAYKSARTNIMFSLSATDKKAFTITSYAKGDGKSTVAANLAISFSKMGKKVILIDCDLRRPNLHNILKLENKAGFSDMVGRMVVFDDVVNRDVLPCLDVLTSGTIPPNPSELICSPEVTRFVERLNREYDYIIFDSPPVGVVADALLLKDYIDTIRDKYDFIFLDCPAGLGVTVINALYTSDAIIIPTQAHYLSIEALQNVFSKLSMIWRHTGSKKPFILGILFTWYRGYTTNDSQILEKMMEQFSNVPFFKTRIPQFTIIPESDVAKVSIFSYRPNHPAAAIYSELVDEFLDKVDMLADRAFEDQCTTANPRLPLIPELKEILLDSYYGKEL